MLLKTVRNELAKLAPQLLESEQDLVNLQKMDYKGDVSFSIPSTQRKKDYFNISEESSLERIVKMFSMILYKKKSFDEAILKLESLEGEETPEFTFKAQTFEIWKYNFELRISLIKQTEYHEKLKARHDSLIQVLKLWNV